MSRLVYVPFWEAELVQLVEFLKANNYTPTEIAHIELLIEKEHYENI